MNNGMMPGVMDMEGGPMISGEWMNTKTGEKVVVRDSYIDGDNMVVLLTNGKQLTLDEFNDYVQMSNEVYDEHGNVIGNADTTPTPATSKPQRPAVDASKLFEGMGDAPTVTPSVPTATMHQELEPPIYDNPVIRIKDDKQVMIEKLFDKTSWPLFTVSIDWKDCPELQIEMLHDIYDITPEDISQTIVNKYLAENLTALKDTLIAEVNKAVNDVLQKD